MLIAHMIQSDNITYTRQRKPIVRFSIGVPVAVWTQAHLSQLNKHKGRLFYTKNYHKSHQRHKDFSRIEMCTQQI